MILVLIFVLSAILSLAFCSEDYDLVEDTRVEKSQASFIGCAEVPCPQSFLKQNSMTPIEADVVFATLPHDYNVDLPNSAAFNSDDICTPQAEYFSRLYLDMFWLLFPGLKDVPIHPHDLSGLIVFGILHLLPENEPVDILKLHECVSQLQENFDSSSKILKAFLRVLRSNSTFDKRPAFDFLFDMAMFNNCFYTFEAFIAVGLRKCNKDLFLKSIASGQRLGDLRLATRISVGLNFDERLRLGKHYSNVQIWPMFTEVAEGHMKFSLENGKRRFNSQISFPNSLDTTEVQSYQVVQKLAEGSYGACFAIHSKETKKRFALKIAIRQYLATKASRKERAFREIFIQSSLNHKNIVRLYHVFENNTYIYMIMEFCEQQALSDIVEKGTLPEGLVSSIVKQIFLALEYLHSKGIVHRDIKPSNLFMHSNGTVKLGDFGYADFISTEFELKFEKCGTLDYSAPELHIGLGYRFEVDIWSAGVVLYYLLERFLPFFDEDTSKTKDLIITANYQFSVSHTFSEAGCELIRRILVADPALRLNIRQILSHPFICNQKEV